MKEVVNSKSKKITNNEIIKNPLYNDNGKQMICFIYSNKFYFVNYYFNKNKVVNILTTNRKFNDF